MAESKLKAHPLFTLIREQVKALYASIRQKMEGGLSLLEGIQLARDVLTCIRNITDAVEASPESRRELAILLAADAWEEFVVPIDLPGPLDLFVDPAGRVMIPILVGHLYDLLADRDLPDNVVVA